MSKKSQKRRAATIHYQDEQALTGAHNSNPDTLTRVLKTNSYRDLSTLWVTPTRDHRLDDQVVFQSWMGVLKPMNQKFAHFCIGGGEIADAYNLVIELMLKDPIKWKYLLTVEVDNLPPKDGLLKLYEGAPEFDAIGGLYWTKEEKGEAMIYGNPNDPDLALRDSFLPQPPTMPLQPCNGLGMGFTLFSTEMFRRMEKPWFQTPAEGGTQDLYFFSKAKKAGFKFACNTEVKVGHLDFDTRKIW